jgi:hypothetical protein
MIEELTNRIDHFGGAANRMCCFAHVINLCAKTMLHQFEGSGTDDDSSEVENKNGNGDDEEVDNVEGWVDELEEMLREKRVVVERNVEPIKQVIVKVSS